MTIKPVTCPHCNKVIGSAHAVNARSLLKLHIEKEHNPTYVELLARAKTLKALTEEFSEMTCFSDYHFYLR